MYMDPRYTAELYRPTRPLPDPTPLPTVIPNLPQVHYETVGDTGKRTLWVVCVIMGLSSLAFYAMATRVPVQKRLFHILTAFITTFAFLSYFAMATGDGILFQKVDVSATKQHIVTDVYVRQVFWARYIDWTITTPLLLIDLGLIAGLNGASILVAVVADIIMVLTGLFGAVAGLDSQRWGWYTVACIAYLVVVHQVAYNGSHAVTNKDHKMKSFFQLITAFILIIWTAYPIIWGVADGAHKMTVDSEIVAYAVLDVLAKPVFGFWLLTTHDRCSRHTPTFDGFWAHGATIDGTIRVGDDRH